MANKIPDDIALAQSTLDTLKEHLAPIMVLNVKQWNEVISQAVATDQDVDWWHFRTMLNDICAANGHPTVFPHSKEKKLVNNMPDDIVQVQSFMLEMIDDLPDVMTVAVREWMEDMEIAAISDAPVDWQGYRDELNALCADEVLPIMFPDTPAEKESDAMPMASTTKPTAYHHQTKAGRTWVHFPYHPTLEEKAALARMGFNKYVTSSYENLDTTANHGHTSSADERISLEALATALPAWSFRPAGIAGFAAGIGSSYQHAPPWMEIASFYKAEQDPDPMVYVKLFTPDSSWTWYMLEYDEESMQGFGLVDGFEAEIGYFSLEEIKTAKGPLGLHIERDKWFEPKPVRSLTAYKDEWGSGGPYKGTPAASLSLPDGWAEEDILYLLDIVNGGTPIVMADKALNIPTIHDDFGGVRAEHIGFGVFMVKGLHFKLTFDGGQAMTRTPSGKGFSTVQIEGEYPYDYDHVKRVLMTWLGEDAGPKKEETKPTPVIALLYGDNGKQVYFESDSYLLLNPYTDVGDRRYAAGWSLNRKSAGNYEPVDDVAALDRGDEACQIGAYSLKEAVRQSERALGVTVALVGKPDDLPDSYPTINLDELEKMDTRPAPEPQKLTMSAATALLDEAMSQESNPDQTLTLGTLDALVAISDADPDQPDEQPIFNKQLTGQAADELLAEANSLRPPGFNGPVDGIYTEIPLGAYRVLYDVPGAGADGAKGVVWDADTKTLMKYDRANLLNAKVFMAGMTSYVRDLGYHVLSVSKDFESATVYVKVAGKKVSDHHVFTSNLHGEVNVHIDSSTLNAELQYAVISCYNNPSLPDDWHIEGLHLSEHIRTLFQAAYDMEGGAGDGRVFRDDLMATFREITKNGDGLLSPIGEEITLWNVKAVIESLGLDVIVRERWQYVAPDQRRLAINYKNNEAALLEALGTADLASKRKNMMLSALADMNRLPDVYVDASTAGMPEGKVDVIPAAAMAPVVAPEQSIQVVPEVDEAWAPAPEDIAEYEQWKLEITTGRLKGRGAFHQALEQIQRSGALRVALEGINGDQQRRELIEKALKTLEKTKSDKDRIPA